jgi:uncharacterized protein YaiL (DUF2058 family)
MAISLQDQLLKAGVASKKQANTAKANKRKKKGETTAAVDPEIALKQQTEKREKDRLLNLENERQKSIKADLARARQIVQTQSISIPKGADIAHQFSHLNFVKVIYVDKQLQSQLFYGQLTIIFMDDKYSLIPTAQAIRVHELQSDWVVALPEKETLDEDDPYAAYEIPDDLMW